MGPEKHPQITQKSIYDKPKLWVPRNLRCEVIQLFNCLLIRGIFDSPDKGFPGFLNWNIRFLVLIVQSLTKTSLLTWCVKIKENIIYKEFHLPCSRIFFFCSDCHSFYGTEDKLSTISELKLLNSLIVHTAFFDGLY